MIVLKKLIGKMVTNKEVNNILLNNDRIIEDLKGHLEQVFGVETRDRYFALFEKLRSESVTPITWGPCKAIALNTLVMGN
jgi:hypothetical protein